MNITVNMAIQTEYDLLEEEDVSDAMFFARLEDAAQRAGSKDPNGDVWDFLQELNMNNEVDIDD